MSQQPQSHGKQITVGKKIKLKQIMHKVIEEVAVNEVLEFVIKFNRKANDVDKVLDLYPDVVEAVKLGNLDLSGESPKLKLLEPIKTEDGDAHLEAVTFKTRMKPSDHRRVSKGIDVSKDQLLFGHRCIGFIIDQEVAMLDKIGREDYKIIDQLSTLFI